MNHAPFEQNIIAMVWDCDKPLISKYMQDPLFRHYGIDDGQFWAEVNGLKLRYGAQGIAVNSDTGYPNHILTYVKAGIFNLIGVLFEPGENVDYGDSWTWSDEWWKDY